MTQGLIEQIEGKRSKMNELAFSSKGRQLSAKFEKLNFLREALISAVNEISDECDIAMYEYCNYIGIEVSPDRLARILEAKSRKGSQKDGVQS